MDLILQQRRTPARDKKELLGLLFLGLAYFLWPYYDAPSLLLFGKLLLIPLFFLYLPYFQFPTSWSTRLLILGGLGFLSLAYLSCFWSPAPVRTFKHVTEEVLLNLTSFGAAAFWAAKASEKSLNSLFKLAFLSFLWVLGLYVFFFLWWHFTGTPLFPLDHGPKGPVPTQRLFFFLPDIHDVILNRQNFASYLLFPASMALAYLITASSRKDFLKGLFWCFLFVGFIFVTAKRSALLGIFTGSFLGALLSHRYRALIGIFLLVVIIASLVFFTPLKRYFIRENFRLFFSGNKKDWARAGSIPVRYYGLPFYLRYIAQHPLRGIGFGRSNIKLNPEVLALAKKAHIIHAHNVWVNFALYLGLPGLMFFLLFLGAKGFVFWQGFSRAGPLCWLLLGFVIYLVAFWIRYQFDDSFRYATSALYFLNTGLGVGLSLRQK